MAENFSKINQPQNQERIAAMIWPLLSWYYLDHRQLPWRSDPTPYHVWISEVMLQQTRVEAVKDYYHRFMQRYPDVWSLAQADPEQLSKCWEGLGYYSRMRNLHRCAKQLAAEYNAQLPADYKKLLTLPGIGRYTAGAIASIAYQIPVPAVDGNVCRVIARMLCLAQPMDQPKVRDELTDCLLAWMPKERPGDFNQAMMELGATVCLPNGAPLCEKCPVADFCMSFQNGTQLDFPKKTPKKPRKIEPITFLLLESEGKILLRKRPDSGLLASLWEYPNCAGWLTQAEVEDYCKQKKISYDRISPLPDQKHIFTHLEWQIKGYWIQGAVLPEIAENEQLVSLRQMRKEFAVPSAFDKYDLTQLKGLK